MDRSETTRRIDDDDDVVLLCYSKLIEVNCKNVEKVTVNYERTVMRLRDTDTIQIWRNFQK